MVGGHSGPLPLPSPLGHRAGTTVDDGVGDSMHIWVLCGQDSCVTWSSRSADLVVVT